MQKTYVMIKPHFANYEIVIKEIKRRLAALNLNIIKEGFVKYEAEDSRKHYEEHLGKAFYPNLEEYITSDKAYGMILEGEGAIEKVRNIAGSTIKKDKETGELILPPVGTIRRDIADMLGEECRLTENVLHSSDSEKSAANEIDIFENLLNRHVINKL